MHGSCWMHWLFTCTSLFLFVNANEKTIEKYAADRTDNYSCRCDLKNAINSAKLTATASEHAIRTPAEFDIDIASCHNAVFRREEGRNETTPLGNWNITRSGVITFFHKPHKTGKARFHIVIDEIQGENCSVSTYYELTITEDQDYPILFAAKNHRSQNLTKYNNLTDFFQRISFTVEQNTGNNIAYSDLKFTTGIYDYDADESIEVRPDNLLQTIQGLLYNYNVSNSSVLNEPELPGCELPDSARLQNGSEWDTELFDTYPCGLSLPYPSNELSWFINLVAYKPKKNFFGAEEAILIFRDKYMLESKLFVTIYVLQNPCINEGVCVGPQNDKQCLSEVRATGFFENGYLCQCTDGWVGDICHIDFDDCSSSPCLPPKLCKDKFRGFECVCPENMLNCDPWLSLWQIGVLVLTMGFLFSVLMILLVSYSTTKLKYHTNTVSDETTELEMKEQNRKEKRIAEILRKGRRLQQILETEETEDEFVFDEIKPRKQSIVAL